MIFEKIIPPLCKGRLGGVEKIIAIIAVFFLAISAVVCACLVYINRDVGERESAVKIGIVKNLLSGNMETGGADSLEKLSGMRGIEKILILDKSGNIISPLSMSGERFMSHKIVSGVLTKGEAVKLSEDKEYTDILIPLPIDTMEAAVFLRLKREGAVSSTVFVTEILILAVFTAVLVFALIKSINHSVVTEFRDCGISGYSLLKNEISVFEATVRSEAYKNYEESWRRLVCLLPEAAFVLDGDLQLIEMNKTAQKLLDGNRCLKEGAHIVEILKDHALLAAIGKPLIDIKSGRCDMISEDYMDKRVSIISHRILFGAVKYTVLFQGGG